LLARAPRTEAELEARLVAKGYQRATAAATVARCRELGYVGDEAYAHERARGLRARGWGSLRITADLEGRGLPERFVERAVEETRDGLTERDWARKTLARARLTDPSTAAERSRAWRLLAGRGFDPDLIADLLGEPG
jgi:regulatory protein